VFEQLTTQPRDHKSERAVANQFRDEKTNRAVTGLPGLPAPYRGRTCGPQQKFPPQRPVGHRRGRPPLPPHECGPETHHKACSPPKTTTGIRATMIT